MFKTPKIISFFGRIFTNNYRSIYSEPLDNEANLDLGTLGLSLTKFEKEFHDHQLAKGSQNSIAIIRAIQFLRYSEIKFEGLHKLHLRCQDDLQRSRYREFNQKVQNLLFKCASQRVLDDVNRFLTKETRGASEREASVQRRFDKYVPQLTQALCDFFGEKYEVKKTRLEERERLKKTIASSTNENPEKRTESEPEKRQAQPIRGQDPGQGTGKDQSEKRKRSAGFLEEDYVGFSNFLELAMASGQVRISAPASVEAVIWTFR